jgi:hypothetical protein
MPYCVSAADEASVPDAVYARMPPEVPAARFVPPLATGRIPARVEIVGLARNTAAPDPKPSVYTMALVPVGIVTSAPEPCLMIMLWLPAALFSMIQTLDTVLGAIVRVRVAVRGATVEVILRYMERKVSTVPSAMVKVSFASPAMFFTP